MLATNKSILYEHAQQYIREVMADLLCQEGFVSWEGEDIHWFRVAGGNVLHAIYFISDMSFPSFLCMRYCCTPLFIPPISTKGICQKNMPGYEQYGWDKQLSKKHNRIYREPDVMVHCPADEYLGRDLLEAVLQVLASAQTPEDCYCLHKQWHEKEIQNRVLLNLSPHFVEEVLYWDDQDLYPTCMDYVLMMERILRNPRNGKPLSKSNQKLLDQILTLKEALTEQKREAYLQVLAQRAQETQKWLQKHTTIRF